MMALRIICTSSKEKFRSSIFVVTIALIILFTMIPATVGDNTAATTTKNKSQDPALAMAEKNLLSLLGMKRRPKPPIDKEKTVIPKAMLDLYRTIHKKQYSASNEEDQDMAASISLPLPGQHTTSANTVRSYTHSETTVDNRFPKNHKFRFLFDISNIPDAEKVTGAELKLSTFAERPNEIQQILAHDILVPGVKGVSGPSLVTIDSKSIHHLDDNTVVNIDVLPAVERWVSDPLGNYGLLVEVVRPNGSRPESSHVRLRRSVESDSDWTSVQPVLLLYTDDGRGNRDGENSRKRRSSPSEGDKKKTTSKKKVKDICQRHQLYVDFERVGWNDWIVAPPGYEAYYCAGDCPFPLADHLNSTNHAIVQSLMHSMYPHNIPKACCVPTHLASISMLYLDEENKVVLKNYQDMSVVGCGCR